LLHQACLTQDIQESVHYDPVVVAHRRSNPVFGAGLIEAISDSEIMLGVKNGVDGIFGRPAILTDLVTAQIAYGNLFNAPANTVGRFGWKAKQATLLAFSGDAYRNEIGVTNRFFLQMPHPICLARSRRINLPCRRPNLRVSRRTRLTTFMQLLAPPPTVPLTEKAQRSNRLFGEVGCAHCHTPSMTTGPRKVSGSLSFKPVPLYSDLLLHHMGSLGDGIVQGAAQADEMRTAPLWGLRGRGPFLHDGRAQTALEAIRLHDGEAKSCGTGFWCCPKLSKERYWSF
jgi:CxxC motif-containing protein (DUF1111 family)